MNKIIKLGGILFAITASTGLILGAVHTITLEPIRAAELKEKNEALAATLPGATDFAPKEVANDESGIVTEVYEGSANGEVKGYNITVTPKGYGGAMTLIVGVDKTYNVCDIKILAHNETPGLGARAGEEKFAGQFKNKPAQEELTVTKVPAEKPTEIQAISGATITSRAVTRGVNTAVNYVKKNFGGEASAQENSAPAADTVSGASEKKEEGKTND